MKAVTSATELEQAVGSVLGESEWVKITAEDIAEFGRLTGDRHWMHVDRNRAASEGPFGDVIAHGFFLLALVTGLANECYSVANATRWTNYGLDRVRFTAPVVAGRSVRLKTELKEFSGTTAATRIVLSLELELEGSDRPALVADWIVLVAEDDK